MTRKQLEEQIRAKQSYLCVGLDTDSTKLPKHLQGKSTGVVDFNKAIINATSDYCVSYKLNTAFYEAQGIKGWEAMQETLTYISDRHFKIADAKRGDIGNTSTQYAKTFFEVFAFDAITVAPYMGEDSVRPFLEYNNKFTIVLGLTSNIGSHDFQQLQLTKNNASLTLNSPNTQGATGKFLFEQVIERVASWGTPDNLMFVVGATKATDLTHIRTIIPHHFLLVPGVGAQGGSLEEVTRYGMNNEVGLLVNASRAIIFAGGNEDFAEQAAIIAKQYQAEMQSYLSL